MTDVDPGENHIRMEPMHKRLKRLRDLRGFSALEVARAIGVPASTYREWEYGRAIRGEPYLKIAEVLGVSLIELLSGQSPKEDTLSHLVLQLEELLLEFKKHTSTLR